MLEAIFGCVTLCAWALGLYFYPTCLDSFGECCDRQNENMVMDETVADYVVPENVLVDSILAAKEVKSGESPLFSAQIKLPVAKSLKSL